MIFTSCSLGMSNCFFADAASPATQSPSAHAPYGHPSEDESEQAPSVDGSAATDHKAPSSSDDDQAPSTEKQQPNQYQGPSHKVVTPKDSPEGKVLASDEGHFSVKVPEGFSEIDMETQSVDTEAGKISTVNYSASSEHSTYIVGASEYPQDILNAIKGKEQEIFDGAQEGLLMHMRGKVTAKNNVLIDGHKARTVDFTAHVDNETLYGRLELILAEPRLFHMLYITNQQDELDGKNAKDFFSSLKIK